MLKVWAMEESALIMALNPNTMAEVDMMANRIRDVSEVAEVNDMMGLWERLSQVRAGLSGLDRARAMLGDSKDPAVRQAYAQALNAPDPGARLSALSRVFDGLGVRDETVLSQAPSRADQTFDDRTRQMVAGLMISGFLRETDGTSAGQELRDFYSTHPLKTAVAPTKMAAGAWYQDGVLSFNEKLIEQYVKSQGRTLDDLGRDPRLLGPLIRENAPVFVHEATHHRQDVWAKSQGLPHYGGEAAEKEAMMVEALFVLQKQRLDPSYTRFLSDNQDRSILVRMALGQSRRLQKDRADWFGESEMARCFPGGLSIAGEVWSNGFAEPIQRELARHARLPEAERRALEDARGFLESYASREDVRRDLSSVGTKHLDQELAKRKEAFEKSPDAYAAYMQRLWEVTELTDRRLDELELTAPKKGVVPLPEGARLKR